jgi:hypothetical protein
MPCPRQNYQYLLSCSHRTESSHRGLDLVRSLLARACQSLDLSRFHLCVHHDRGWLLYCNHISFSLSLGLINYVLYIRCNATVNYLKTLILGRFWNRCCVWLVTCLGLCGLCLLLDNSHELLVCLLHIDSRQTSIEVPFQCDVHTLGCWCLDASE